MVTDIPDVLTMAPFLDAVTHMNMTMPIIRRKSARYLATLSLLLFSIAHSHTIKLVVYYVSMVPMNTLICYIWGLASIYGTLQ